MRRIDKGDEPDALTEHRLSTPGAGYPGLPADVKRALRAALLDEQGHLCCYCMRRIKPERMKIEHWRCQRRHPALDLDHRNLFAACDGNEGQPPARQHCDTRKADADVTINPLDDIEPRLRYRPDGTLTSTDPRFETDINDTLNLNEPQLRRNRAAAMTGMISALSRMRSGRWPPSFIASKIEQLRRRDACGQLTPFCQALIYILEKRLRRC